MTQYIGFWATDAPVPADAQRAQSAKLDGLSRYLEELSSANIVIKHMEIWVDGVEWEWRRVDATSFGDRT